MTAQESALPPRAWDVDSLFVLGHRGGVRTQYLKAIPVLILEKWVQGDREPHVANCIWTQYVVRRLAGSGLGPRLEGKGTAHLLSALTTIQATRNLTRPPLIEYRKKQRVFSIGLPHYEPLLQEYRLEYCERYPEDYTKLYPVEEPDWGTQGISVVQSPDVQSKPLRILEVLEEYEAAWQAKLQEAENRAKAAEQENRRLSGKLSQSDSLLGQVTDEGLRIRIDTLLESPLDTVIREAGVVLEHRLRTAGKAGTDLEGVKLVDALLTPGRQLVFSAHPGEQDGVRMLYRGAMQFIRNPPMHKLAEYSEDTARLLIRLVDSLLQLLSEAELQEPV